MKPVGRLHLHGGRELTIELCLALRSQIPRVVNWQISLP
jgi:hypothetical protein